MAIFIKNTRYVCDGVFAPVSMYYVCLMMNEAKERSHTWNRKECQAAAPGEALGGGGLHFPHLCPALYFIAKKCIFAQ